MVSISRRNFITKSAAAGIGLAYMNSCLTPAKQNSRLYTGLIYDESYLKHPAVGADFPERLSWIYQRFSASGLLDQLRPLSPLNMDDVREHITCVHLPSTLEAIDRCTSTGPGALLAVAGVLGAVKAVAEGIVKNAFCAIRPPGHHAHDNPSHDGACLGQGFCFLNNVAIATRYAQKKHKLKNVLIVDWDYHHGNGTQDFFYDDPSVFFFSVHDVRAYPGTGSHLLTGSGAGKGFNVNVCLDCGASDVIMKKAFSRYLFPALKKVDFEPDIIFISAGFDSQRNDRLGCFDVTPEGFSSLTAMLMDYADRTCNGKIVSLLEGGYSDRGDNKSWGNLAKSAEAHVKTLCHQCT